MVNETTKARALWWPVWFLPQYGGVAVAQTVEKVEFFGSLQVGTIVRAIYKAGFVLDFAIDTIREQEYFSFSVIPPAGGASTKWYFELKDNNTSTQFTMGTKCSWMQGYDWEREMEVSIHKIAAGLRVVRYYSSTTATWALS